MTDDRRAILIRAALAPDADLAAPAGLADAIQSAVRSTPQRRPWFGRLILPERQSLRLAGALAALLLLGVLLALAVGSQHAPSPPGILGYHGPPSRTGVMPGPAPRATPVEIWRATLSGSVGVLGMPLVVDQTVFAADGQAVVSAFTETGGTPVWSASIDRPGAVSLAVIGDLVVAASERGQLSAFQRSTGARAWAVAIGAGGALNVVADSGLIVVASTDAHVYGVDPANGSVIWDVQAGGEVTRGAAIKDGIGVVGDGGGQVTAFRVATGGIIWTRDIGPGEVTTPAIGSGVAYVAHGHADGSAAVLVALDLADGKQHWTWTLPNSGRLFVGAVAESVTALDDLGTAWNLDPTTGAATVLYRASGAFGSVGAIVGPELILTSADGAVFAIDRTTGAVHWTVTVEGVPTTPSVIDGRVFVATDRGVLLALGDAPSASVLASP